MAISPIVHVKKPRRSPLRLRFLAYTLEEISCAICITYFPTIPYCFVIFDLQQHLHIILFQPVIDLQEIRQQLRSSHELSVEGSAVVGGLADIVEHFAQINQLAQWCARVGEYLDNRGAQQVFIGGVIGLRVGAFAPVEDIAREQSVRSGAQ